MRLMSSVTGEGDPTVENHSRRGGGGGCVALSRNESVRGLECSKGIECYSPARVAVCRLLAVVRKCKGRRRAKVTANEGSKPEYDSDQSAPRTREHDGSGLQRQEITFNVAAGIGLLSLIAASKTELNKTVELRRQMEMFLRNVKEEHDSSEGTTPKISEPEVTYAVSTTIDGLSNLSPYSHEDHAPELSQQESGISFGCDKHWDMVQRDKSMDGMNHLEKEFEAELERLQLDIETQGYREAGIQEEVTDQISSNNNATGTYTDVSSGEAVDQRDPVTPEHYGVPPLELERRLHELLETRQEERIKELESCLEFMKKQLQEKEMEVTWWKDTAKVISKQVPESTRVLRTSAKNAPVV